MDNFDEDIPATARVSESRYKGSRSKGGGINSRGGRRGAAGGNKDTMISKALSKLLRHQAEKAGIALDGEGFARMDEVVGSSFFYAAY